MDRLSAELRSLIVSTFAPNDYKALLNLSATNKTWYYTVSDDLLWKRLSYEVHIHRRVVIPIEELAPYTPKRFFLALAQCRCIVCGVNEYFHFCEFKKCYMCMNCTNSPNTPYGYRHMYSTQAKKELNLSKEAIDKLPKETFIYRPSNSTAVLVRDIYPDIDQFNAQISLVSEAKAARVRRHCELRSQRDEKALKMLTDAGLTRSECYWPLRQQLETFSSNGLNIRKLQSLIHRECFFRYLMKKLELDGRKVIAANSASISYCKGITECPLQLETSLVGLNKTYYGLSK